MRANGLVNQVWMSQHVSRRFCPTPPFGPMGLDKESISGGPVSRGRGSMVMVPQTKPKLQVPCWKWDT
jgi:hypothetical protein